MLINRRNSLLLISSSFLLTGIAKSDVSSIPSMASFMAAMQELEAASGGRLGVSIYDNNSRQYYSYRGDEHFPFCSTFKFLLAAAAVEKFGAPDGIAKTKISLTNFDIVPNSPQTRLHRGEEIAIEKLCEWTVTLSDNGAANALLRAIGGISAFNNFARSLGDRFTRLDRPEPFLNTAMPNDARDTTTPMAMLRNLKKLLLDANIQNPKTQILLQWLSMNTTGGESLKKGLAPNWHIGDKTGAGENNTVNDIGIITKPNGGKILVTAYLTGAREEFPKNKKTLADIGAYICSNFH